MGLFESPMAGRSSSRSLILDYFQPLGVLRAASEVVGRAVDAVADTVRSAVAAATCSLPALGDAARGPMPSPAPSPAAAAAAPLLDGFGGALELYPWFPAPGSSDT